MCSGVLGLFKGNQSWQPTFALAAAMASKDWCENYIIYTHKTEKKGIKQKKKNEEGGNW